MNDWMKMGYCLIVDKDNNEHRFKSSNPSEIYKFVGKRKDIKEIRIEWKDIKK